mgnify:CR=1 FL=1
MPINIRLIYDKANSKVEIRLVKIFNIKFPIGKVLKFFATTRENRDKVTLEGLVFNYKLFTKTKPLIMLLCNMGRVKKVTISAGINYDHYLLVVNSWVIVDRFKKFLHNTFSKVENEHYMINHSEEIYFASELIIETRIIFVLIAIIIKIKNLFKVLKFMRLYYGKSNI